MIRRPKKPKLRLAPQSVRDEAARYVRAFRTQEPIVYAGIKNGEIATKPIDAEFLAAKLDALAKTGLFDGDNVSRRKGRDFLIGVYFDDLYPGVTKERAVAAIADRLGCSEKTVANTLMERRRKK